ncbi:MAG: TonB-dependent receptor [Flavobacterium sp.]
MNTIITVAKKPLAISQKALAKEQETRSNIFHNFLSSFLFSLFSFFLPLYSFSQEKPKDSTQVKLDEVLVSGVRINKETPVTFSNLSKQEIAKRNLGQDIPVLMNYMPSVVTTSDAGNGFGYTSFKVRGSDATRTNVTINGIPYNDSESSGTYFVNMPDFASSLQSIQLQRGVGTSTNGGGAFGASLNMLTDSYSKKASGEIASSYGSFNSRKNTVKFSTGLMNDHFEIAGRLSVLHSDGYVDRASSDLKSYFLQGTYVGKTTLIKALAFGGHEKTYQAWYGVDKATLETNPTFNAAGMYTDEFGNTRFYDNQTDNYSQNHYQLHWNEKINPKWQSNLALHYTKGKGYYENYQDEADFASYGLTPVPGVTTTDLINRKWLDNDFYGTTFSLNYKDTKTDFIFGGAANKYEGNHFGNIIWARYASASQPEDKYYENYGNKLDLNSYAKVNYKLGNHWSLFGDIQFRHVNYQANGVTEGTINKNYNFVNPKAGLTYLMNENNDFYFSYAVANREPSRIDFENGNPIHEKLNDYELGWRMSSSKVTLNTNFYFMNYTNQLVKTGELNDVGYEIHANVPQSYRAGFEVDATLMLSKKISFSPNMTLSSNKIKNYTVDTGNGLVNYGTTNIAFSPEIITGAALSYKPVSDLQLTLLHKYVGEQFAGNFDSEETKLNAYSLLDFNAVYELKTKKIFKSIVFTGLINNLLDKKYVSNAYLYGDNYMSYFPQAGINFMAGMTLKF